MGEEAIEDPFEVSVVIPVYNAAPYVRQAVESALAQPEVREVLLVEDGSPDNALEVCQELASEYPQVVLLRHPNGENCGAGASRNLGMRTASCLFLAFLDADDYYLPNRFKRDAQVFREVLCAEGVYHAVEMHVEDSEGLKRWREAGKAPSQAQTVTREIPPENLAEALLVGGSGYFILDAFTIKKSVLEKEGFMREDLRLHQDTEWILRVAMSARLLPGNLKEPVARWRVHARNRISSPRGPVQKLDDRLAMYNSLYTWCGKYARQYQKHLMPLMLDNIISSVRFTQEKPKPLQRKLLRVNNLLGYLVSKPSMIVDKYFWQALSAELNIVKKAKSRG